MKKIFAAFSIFVATYFLLSIDLSGRPVFSYLYDLTSPFSKSLQKSVESLMGKGIVESKEVGGKLFNNSLPKKATILKNEKAPEESLSEAEKIELNSLIKNYAK
ncbi:MAG: hypothetical protein K2P81_04420 [Bacteriovoracaceae bacterium]|nr:hypothetical protein [Bacteriovoracaceae bacterium]